MEELNHPILEAERYLQNARQILSEKAGKDGEYYVQDGLEEAQNIIDWAKKHYRN